MFFSKILPDDGFTYTQNRAWREEKSLGINPWSWDSVLQPVVETTVESARNI